MAISDLLPIGCLVVVGDHCCVISKVNDSVGVMPGRAVMSEQGVQEGTENSPEGPLCCYLPLPPGGRSLRKSRIQLQREVFSPTVLSLLVSLMSFEGTMVLNAEL